MKFYIYVWDNRNKIEISFWQYLLWKLFTNYAVEYEKKGGDINGRN